MDSGLGRRDKRPEELLVICWRITIGWAFLVRFYWALGRILWMLRQMGVEAIHATAPRLTLRAKQDRSQATATRHTMTILSHNRTGSVATPLRKPSTVVTLEEETFRRDQIAERLQNGETLHTKHASFVLLGLLPGPEEA